MSTHHRPLSAEPRTSVRTFNRWVTTVNRYFKGKTPEYPTGMFKAPKPKF